jgi:hypothetical protein
VRNRRYVLPGRSLSTRTGLAPSERSAPKVQDAGISISDSIQTGIRYPRLWRDESAEAILEDGTGGLLYRFWYVSPQSPRNSAGTVREGARWAIHPHRRQPDDLVGPLLDRLSPSVLIEIRGRESGVCRVNAPTGMSLRPLNSRHVQSSLEAGYAKRFKSKYGPSGSLA